MKLVVLMCICVLLVAVDCRPVKRAESPPVTAEEGNSIGNFKVGTTYTVTLESGSGSGSGEEEIKPDFEAISLTDFARMFYEAFGASPEEWLRKHQNP